MGGNDDYATSSFGTNGGGFGGVGLLVDAAGDDSYDATSDGANGGARISVGFLVDGGGNDTYAATGRGTNGRDRGTLRAAAGCHRRRLLHRHLGRHQR